MDRLSTSRTNEIFGILIDFCEYYVKISKQSDSVKFLSSVPISISISISFLSI